MKRLLFLPFLIGLAFAQSPTPGSRTVLNNPKVQTDIDMANHSLLNVQGTTLTNLSPKDVWISATRSDGKAGGGTQIDPIDGSTLTKFYNAVHSLPPYSSVHLTSDAAFSTSLNIDVAGITIDGGGHKLSAGSQGQVVMIQITAADITVKNLEMSCGRTSGTSIANSGHIEITGAHAKVINCHIHDGIGIGIRMMDGSSHAYIADNFIEHTGNSILAQPGPSPAPNLTNLTITHNRCENAIGAGGTGKGIYIGTTDAITVVENSEISFNSVENTGDSGIEVWRAHKQIRVLGNHTKGCVFGISLDGDINFVVSGNQVQAATSYGIEIPNGCDHGLVVGNDIDGRVSGSPAMSAGVSISNNILSTDLVLSGNTIRGYTVSGVGGSNFSGLSASGNLLTQESPGAIAFQLKDVVHSAITGNIIRITAGDAPIVVDSTDLACSDITIGSNKFVGAPSTKLIVLLANIHNISNVTVTDNTAFDCTFLASGFINYATSGGGAISNVFRAGNLPDRTTLSNNQSGWDNDRFEESGPDSNRAIGTSPSATNPSYRLFNASTLEGDFALAGGSGAYATGASVNDVVVRSITGAVWIDALGNKPINFSTNDAVRVTINPSGDVTFPHLADTAATNDSWYYSTTQSKAAYKDSGGVVHTLY